MTNPSRLAWPRTGQRGAWILVVPETLPVPERHTLLLHTRLEDCDGWKQIHPLR